MSGCLIILPLSDTTTWAATLHVFLVANSTQACGIAMCHLQCLRSRTTLEGGKEAGTECCSVCWDGATNPFCTGRSFFPLIVSHHINTFYPHSGEERGPYLSTSWCAAGCQGPRLSLTWQCGIPSCLIDSMASAPHCWLLWAEGQVH